MNIKTFVALLTLLLVLAACTSGEAAVGPRVYFTNVNDGDTVTSPVTLKWAAEGFTIEPAGDVHAGAGHLHVMVDVPCVAAGEAVPADEQHLHFGKAQLETVVELAPGPHTLCLQAADGQHTALAGAGMTQVIEMTVE